jgi:hypothetical protein
LARFPEAIERGDVRRLSADVVMRRRQLLGESHRHAGLAAARRSNEQKRAGLRLVEQSQHGALGLGESDEVLDARLILLGQGHGEVEAVLPRRIRIERSH